MVAWNLAGGCGMQRCGWISYECLDLQQDRVRGRWVPIGPQHGQPDGTFLTPFGVEVSAADYWDMVTVEIADEHGNIESRQIDPHWVSGTANIYIDSWTPGERAYIVGVHLGKYWRWDNSTLLNVSLDLRGVNTEIGGELEISSSLRIFHI